ncbi:sodium:solute symporter family protein [Massilia sp.]|uniref:sodium:solute symporter family protein n=1 Tax=Massilia sp. TaxID=1882437 RepID=UPI00391D3A58
MGNSLALHTIDWVVISLYLSFALIVGLWASKLASGGVRSYFLADRSLPWWWAGASIAATTFAADTPLAVAGIIATKGVSGNWIWLAWMGVHAAVVVLFAESWSRSGVMTDAELIARRYSGRSASVLRTARAGLYGIVYNAIILGWVLRAMVKIASPFFHWDTWFPGLMHNMALVWPANSPMGTPSDGLTIILLLGLVVVYSSLSGIRGVIVTDLVQLGLALVGSVWFACLAWSAVGGREGLSEGLSRLYGADHMYLDLFPDMPGATAMAFVLFGLYILVQSYANVPADGGGYLMQRLNATRSPADARKASLLFLVLQYVVRVWPWLVVGLAALVLIPIGGEGTALGGAGAVVAGDREQAYPVLMGVLLHPGLLGLMVASLLAAFMSTIDTHMNWGASYIVNDVYLRLSPNAPVRRQIGVARLAVLGFAVGAVAVSFQIETIEQAWKWVAALGAALGAPTALRWIWWRVNAAGELGAMVAGLAAVLALAWLSLPYETELLIIAGASLLGLAAGMIWGPPTDPATLRAFAAEVAPIGFWPGASRRSGARLLAITAMRWAGVVGGTVALLVGGHRMLLLGELAIGLAWLAGGVLALGLGARAPAPPQP